tara:strand:+ start:207 stop:1373 length:1167 start_codon:yes stop_codon:yes gene_type:complete
MKKNLLLILVLYFSPIYSNWQEINTPTSQDLYTIEIIDDNAFCGGKNGILLKSIDQGETWTEINTTASGNITSILFINSNIGFFTTSEGEIFQTLNKGLDWTEKFTHVVGINGIDFRNKSTGIAVGDNGNIFKTLDGGDNWINLGSQSIYRLNDVAFLNDSLVLAVGPAGSYLFSTDAGKIWSQKNTNSGETFFAIEKSNNSKASIVGTNGTYCEFDESNLSIGEILKIDIAGDWLKDIHIIRKEDGSSKSIIVGFNSSLYIENEDWKIQDINFSINLNSVHFYNDTIGIVCGSSGKIYKTISGGVPYSINNLTQITLKVYPNPAENILYIKESEKYKKINIYNTFGQLILVQEVINNQIDISGFTKGNYYITLQSSNEIVSGRFTKR